MEEKYTIEMEVPSYMADYSKRLRPDSFMALAQEMALKAASDLGFGYDDMANENGVWVLSRLHVVFERMPLWREIIKMQTWHKGLDGLLFLRDFDLRGSDGESLIKATSSWLIMNVTERRLVRPDSMGDMVPKQAQFEEDAIAEHAAKLVIPRGAEPTKVRSHTVNYSDLDFLGHVNNTKYMCWALNCISDIALSRPMKEFQINFNHETRMGETVTFYRWDEADGSIFIEGKAEGHQVFITKLIFA